MLNNGADRRNMQNLSKSPYLEQNIDDRVKVPQDNSHKKLKNSEDRHIEEKMFPAGIIANLEKDIRKPPLGFYIGTFWFKSRSVDRRMNDILKLVNISFCSDKIYFI